MIDGLRFGIGPQQEHRPIASHLPCRVAPPPRRLMGMEHSPLQSRDEDGATFERSLAGSDFVDWLLQEGEAATRAEAEQLGRRLLEHGIIQHGEMWDGRPGLGQMAQYW